MTVRILQGDCRDVLATLPDVSVHCVVTSPPYWGLRDYGVSGQIGLESTYQAFVREMVGVFREVRRVLRADGTLWLNLGDSYAGGGTIGRNDAGRNLTGGGGNKLGSGNPGVQGYKLPAVDLKPKDLCGIPWRVAFALQDDGWYLRQDLIWAKPNPMPESVTDRCTKSHEYLFLMSKSARYYFDAEAIKEPFTGNPPGERGLKDKPNNSDRRDGGTVSFRPDSGVRNKRSVWEVATHPYAEAHFATFPPALIEPCIKAGTSEKGCCAKCGAPWVREVKKSGGTIGKGWHAHEDDLGTGQHGGTSLREGMKDYCVKTVGWKPSCLCCINDVCRAPVACKGFGHCRQPYIEGEWPAPVPCTVLDPFGGAGTTGLVSDRLQRNAILIELNPQYAAMAERRIAADSPLFAEPQAAE